MFQKLGDALRRFMYGRYGADSLNKWLLIFAVILILLGSLGSRYLAPWMAAFNTLAYVPLIWSLFRMYSRNIEARRRENAAFQRFFTRLRDRQNRYFTCGCLCSIHLHLNGLTDFVFSCNIDLPVWAGETIRYTVGGSADTSESRCQPCVLRYILVLLQLPLS